jgi:RNA polymerase sigma factor (sigma-70 family)
MSRENTSGSYFCVILTIMDSEMKYSEKFNQLYGEFLSVFERKALKLCDYDKATASDILQESAIKGWRKKDTFFEQNENVDFEIVKKKFTGWMNTTIVRTYLDARRLGKTYASLDQLMEDSNFDIPVDDQTTVSDLEIRAAHIIDAINALEPQERELIDRYHIRGEDLNALASDLQIPVNTVKSRLSRYRQRVRDILQAQDMC